MAIVGFTLNAANTQLIINSSSQLLLADPFDLYNGTFTPTRVGNDLLIDFGGMGSILVVGQFATVTPVLTSLQFAEENDDAIFNFSNSLSSGTSGNDLIIGNVSNNSINGLNGNNEIFGGGGNDTLSGGSEYDELRGGDGDDSLVGNGGDDDFNPGAGNDTIIASGVDWQVAYYEDSNSAIIVNFSGQTIDGQATNTVKESAGTTDILTGIEMVSGSAGNDTFHAGRLISWQGGDPAIDATTFQGMGGNDTFVAGGFDRGMQVEYNDSKQAVAVNLSNTTKTLLGASVESNRALDGLGGTDTFDLTQSGWVNITGSRFSDHLVGSESRGTTLVGDAGNDTLVGGTAIDTAAYWGDGDGSRGIFANLSASPQTDWTGRSVDSNRVIDSFGNLDVLENIENIQGSDNNDLIFGAAGSLIRGGDGNDILVGSNDAVVSDGFDAGNGVDMVDGGAGTSDYLQLQGNRADYKVIKLSSSEFRLIKTDATQDIYAINIESFSFWDGAFNSTNLNPSGFLGEVGDDTFSTTAHAGSHILSGLEGNDSLTAGGGNDTLIGGPGSDTLVGGAGNDVYFLLGAGSDSITENSGGGTDRIETNLANYSMAGAANVENLSFIGLWGGFNGTGNTLANVISGGGGNDGLSGSDGNDTLLGGAGADVLTGGNGSDVLDGGVITDKLNGSDFNAVSYAANVTAVTVNLGAGAGVGNGTASDGSGGTDTLININRVTGGSGNDSITGSSAFILEQFVGGAGNDTINGGLISDTLSQENSNRVIYSSVTGAGVTVDLAAGTAIGAAGSNAGSDTLLNINQVAGSNLNDTLSGSDSALTEQFEGLAGNNTIDGRGGIDIVRYDSASGPVTVNLADGTATGSADADTLFNIEGVRGSKYNDNLIGGHAANGVSVSDGLLEFFMGNAGDDSIDGGQGFDRVDYTSSTQGVVVNLATGSATDGLGGSDSLSNIEGVRGSSFADTLLGSDADFEVFEGREDSDAIDGKGGFDRVDYTYSKAGVWVNLATGAAVDGYGNVDALLNIEGVRGSSFNDILIGSNNASAIESFEGRAGSDNINGQGGTDRVDYHSSLAGVNVNLATGTASDGFGATDTLANIEDVRGSKSFNDTLTGNAGSNRLEGLGGNDTLNGAAGNDSLDAGTGVDLVDGGADTDTVILLANFASYTRSRPTASDTRLVNASTGENITVRNVESFQFADGLKTLAEVHGGTATGFNDSIVGTAGDDTLDGLAGNDTLVGLAGHDTYVVNAVGDVITENAGEGTDRVLVELAAAGTYVLGANVEDAAINNAVAGVNITGNAENNALLGNSQANILSGGAGDDTLNGFVGSDTLIGGAGSDLYIVDVLSDVVTEGAGDQTVEGLNDRINLKLSAAGTYTLAANVEIAVIDNATSGINLIGNASGNNLIGNDTANSLDGAAGNDSLTGAGGNDTLSGGAGNDSMAGGLGDDVYRVDSLADVVTESSGEGTDRIETALTSYTTLAANVENLTFTGAVAFTGTGNSLHNIIVGGAANDTLDGGDGNDALTGNAGNDRLLGAAGDDTLDGGEGNDTLIGASGDLTPPNTLLAETNTLRGGNGNDLYVLNSTSDVVIEVSASGGIDTVLTDSLSSYTLTDNVENLVFDLINPAVDFSGTGNALANVISGSSGNDSLMGLAGNDTLNGGAGADLLDGGVGTDSLVGGDGDDTYVVNTTSVTNPVTGVVTTTVDAVVEATAQGTDQVNVAFAAAGTYTLTANVENATVTGSVANINITGNELGNTLTGSALSNILSGGLGNDSLSGLAGNDTLNGGDGNDSLSGGDGNDSLLGGAGDDELNAGDGVDSVDGGAGSDSVFLQGNFDAYTISRPTTTDTRLVNAVTGENVIVRNIENFEFADVSKSLSEIWNNQISAFADSWSGTAGDDTVNGLAGNDTLLGLAGNDTLIGGAGSDSMVGGADDDVYEIDVVTDIIIEQGAGGSDQVNVALAIAGTYTLAAEVEKAVVTAAPAIAVNLTGNALNNELTGNAAANLLLGGLGDDTLSGGAGNDTLQGGSGDDVYVLDVASDVVSEASGEGADLVKLAFTSAAAYTMTANVENLEVLSGATININITGNAEANQIQGNGGNNVIVAGSGDDTVTGNGGNDTIDGGLGSDTVILAGVLTDYAITRPSTAQTNFTYLPDGKTSSVITVENITFAGNSTTVTLASLIAQIGSLGNDTLNGGGGDDTLFGGAGNDSLLGAAGNDDLLGGDGLDTLVGGGGNDILDGGVGNDTYQFGVGGGDDIIVQNDALASSIDSIELAAVIGNLSSGESALSRGWQSYNDLVVTVNSVAGNGDAAVDHIVVNDFFLNDLVNTAGAIDQIRFASDGSLLNQSQILAELLKGTSGDDWLRGYANTHDSISGGTGNDQLGGAAGNDTLNGGLGSDTLSGDDGNDLLLGGADFDDLFGGAGNDTLAGDANWDYLDGGEGSDTYLFNSGGVGDTIIETGTAGTDVLSFGAGILAANTKILRVGNDLRVTFTGSSDRIDIQNYFTTGLVEQFRFADGGTWSSAAVFAKALIPSGGNDQITGYMGSELLQGLAGDDTIDGAAGNDTINGGDGTDRLTGGVGADRFVFNTADALLHTDTITDFTSGTDKIALSKEIFDLSGVVGAHTNLAGLLGNGSGVFAYDGGVLSYDEDGAGGVAAVTLAIIGSPSLANDFVIVA